MCEIVVYLPGESRPVNLDTYSTCVVATTLFGKGTDRSQLPDYFLLSDESGIVEIGSPG